MSQYADSHLSGDSDNSSWAKALDHIRPGSRVLDVGCSSGNFGAALMAERACVVDGIELDPRDAARAAEQLHAVHRLNVETDPLDDLDGSYDYLYFGDVLEHLVDPVAALRRVRPLLAADGEVLFSIPNMAHLSVRMMLLQGTFTYGRTGLLDVTHLHFWTLGEVQRVFGEAGYQLESIEPITKDHPAQLLADELATVGLPLTDEFLAYTRTTDASIFQFFGAARPTDLPVVPYRLPESSPADVFQTAWDDIAAHYQQVFQEQAQVLEDHRVHLRDLQGLVTDLQEAAATAQLEAADRTQEAAQLRERVEVLEARLAVRDAQIDQIKRLLPGPLLPLAKEGRRLARRGPGLARRIQQLLKGARP